MLQETIIDQGKGWSGVKSSTPNPGPAVSRIQSLESRMASLDMEDDNKGGKIIYTKTWERRLFLAVFWIRIGFIVNPDPVPDPNPMGFDDHKMRKFTVGKKNIFRDKKLQHFYSLTSMKNGQAAV
jgi:hypothetical protein